MAILQECRASYLTQENFETAAQNGISYHTVHARVYRYDWDVERAITEKPIKKVERGKSPWSRWKDKCVVGRETFIWRIRNGWSEEKAALTESYTKQQVSDLSREYHERKKECNETGLLLEKWY